MFGNFIREKRLIKDLSLREFCRRLNEDPSNWSKIEREINAPPQDLEKLKNIAELLGIREGSDDWNLLIDYAKVDAGIIPDFILKDKEVLQYLPMFFRTFGSVKPTKDEMINIISHLKGGLINDKTDSQKNYN